MRYSASKNSVTPKTRLEVFQGHWKRRRSIAHIYWSAIVNIALSCTVFELFHVELYHDLDIWVWGHSRSFNFKPVPFESLGAISYSPSIVTMAVACIICQISQILIENRDFFIPPCIRPSEYRHPVWCGKTRMVGLPDSGKNFKGMYNRLDSIPACDGRTDRQTDILRRNSPRYARGK